jgi:PAS domain S-box-containing protein
MSAPIILNVDDYEASRYSRTRILRQAGFTVVEAATGTEALRLVVAHRPALVVLDVNLPDMSGFDVCRQIKTNPDTASILVLHLSATSVALQHKLTGLEGGSDSYLTEPIDPEEFIANVRALLRLRHAETALREANFTLEALITASPLAIVAVDLNAHVLNWNLAAERIFGWSAAEVVGKPYPVVPDSLQTEIAAMFEEVDHGDAIHGFETRRRHKLGHLIDVNVSAAPIRNADGRIAGRIAVIEDITERRHVAREMEKLYADAQQANRAKDDFLAVLSHELRTPLNAMLGWVRMLRRTEMTPEKRAHALEVIERNTLAQVRLIEDILDVSRIISGKLRLERQPLNFVEVAHACAEVIRPSAEARGLTLHVVLPEEPAVVNGDAARLQQVLLNLLSNAVKFTGSGRIDLVVAAGDGDVRVLVRDTGLGIEPEFLPHVFDRFRQANSSSTRSQTGLGLGLAIVQHIVEAHGGVVRAHSAGASHGSTFEVVLPTIAQMPVATKPVAAPARVRLDGLRVLVVDDEPDSRELVVTILRLAGAEGLEAGSVDEALACCAATPPDVILADLAMPGEDGYVMLERLRAEPTHPMARIPVLAITGYAGSSDRVQTEAAGFQGHLVKPVDPATLIAAVARTTERA